MKKHRRSTAAAIYRATGAVVLLLLGGLLYLHFTWNGRIPPVSSAQPMPDLQARPPVPEPVTEPEEPEVRPRTAHARFDRQACLARTGARVPEAKAVHRWVDAKGVVHYSDRPPEGQDHQSHTLVAARDVQPVLVEISALDAVLPVQVRDHANTDAVAIGRVFKDVLGIDTQGGLALSIVFAGTDAAFQKAAGKNPVSTSGVYMPGQRKIVVRTQRSSQATLAVLRHEITHALVHEWIGNLPTPLNEGLAEYFEHFTASGMGGRVDPNAYARHMRGAHESGNSQRALTRLLQLPYGRFHASGRSKHYTQSLALISTMMSEPSRRAVLASVLRAQRSTPCDSIDAARVIGRTWPGGLADLAKAWSKHQLATNLSSHSY